MQKNINDLKMPSTCEMVAIGSGTNKSVLDYELSRYACYLIVQNGDPRGERGTRGNLSEVLLWLRLKKGQINGWDFDRQKIIGNFIVDFYCANIGLVVEIDGSSHKSKEEYDSERDAYLRGLGLSVLHISDIDIKRNIDGVIAMILNHPAGVTTPPPAAAPRQRRGISVTE
jgi:very-short-patch-repair endonuclease